MRSKFLILGIAGIALVAAGCGSGSNNNQSSNNYPPGNSISTSSSQGTNSSTTLGTNGENGEYGSGAASSTANNAPLVVMLDAENNSGQTGTATLTDVNGKTQVVLSITGEPKGASEPAHIHVGQCPGVGAVKFPLSSVVNGRSTTTINTTLSALRSQVPLAINVHESAAKINVYYACGELAR